jgi:hypothetical protein
MGCTFHHSQTGVVDANGSDGAPDAPHDTAGDVSPACTRTTVIDPPTAWERSDDNTAWAPVVLPDTNWGCDACTKYFRTTVCDAPRSVDFQWSSDNRARMFVNGTPAFETFWIAGYCSDQPCCTKCCDSATNCLANLSAAQTLDTPALALFAPGDNVVTWEVSEESGGEGFYTVMTVGY